MKKKNSEKNQELQSYGYVFLLVLEISNPISIQRIENCYRKDEKLSKILFS